MLMVATGGVRVVSGLFVVASGVVLGCLLVMSRCVGVMLSGFGVMFGGFLAHVRGSMGLRKPAEPRGVWVPGTAGVLAERYTEGSLDG